MNLLRACDDPNLFGPWFRDRDTWAAWRAFLAALFALPMTEDELATYRACTGRTEPPAAPFTEAWLVCGRRAGKSFVLALCAVYLACFRDWRPHLAPGERATVLVIASDRRQARVIFRYALGLLTNVALLRSLVSSQTAGVIELSNGVSIEVGTASFRSTRGYTLVAALCDELAYWRTDDSAANPDTEILDALRPGMATVPGALLLCASSPYARRGALWEAHQRWHGRDGAPALVWQASTRTMNPTVPQSVVDEALERDPASAAAEWLGTFRSDVESYIGREAVLACVEAGLRERPSVPGCSYFSFTDPSGGSSDSMTCAVCHRDGGLIILDAVREIQAPFDPESATTEFVAFLRSYGIRRTTGDRYASQWVQQAFQKRGISYEASELSKSALYQNLLPVLNGRTVRLLDHPRLVEQICGLERRTARGGRDTIDHAPGARDDVANAVAGALVLASRPSRGVVTRELNR
ncbi:MAG: hypothetical protein WD645_00095, partial [Dehalococcoidia bacterium]